ncbi:hypothetical protein EHM92_01410 [bacterium]|nr:MAG: hypothetical protein EHM92_01410 [bacterium]
MHCAGVVQRAAVKAEEAGRLTLEAFDGVDDLKEEDLTGASAQAVSAAAASIAFDEPSLEIRTVRCRDEQD